MRTVLLTLVTCILSIALVACSTEKSASSRSNGNSNDTGTPTTPTDDSVNDTTFSYTVSINVNTNEVTTSSTNLSSSTSGSVTTLTLDGTDVITVTQDTYGLTIDSSMPEDIFVEFSLSGTTTAKSLTFYSDNRFKLTLNGVNITSTNGPAINIQSGKAFVVLASGTTNTLTDTSTYSTRYLTGTTTAMDLKGCLFSEGKLIFSGTGSLTVTGKYKHGICTDDYVRIVEGNITVTTSVDNGIHTNDGFFMDAGTLAITSTAGKGIKVEGAEDSDNPMGYIIIEGGTISVTSYDKAMTASWKASDDATTSTTADDPSPSVTINGGTITIKTTGTPSDQTGLSPEGIESKTVLTVNDGTLTINTTDDCMNASGSLIINGGYIYCKSSANDSIDSNGSLTINGGVIVSIGSSAPEGPFDCDTNTFAITGGTIVGIGGTTSGPTASACTQNVVIYGSVTSGQTIALKTSDATTESAAAFAYTAPQSASTMIFSSPDIASDTTYYIFTGGSVTDSDEIYSGLYIGNIKYKNGTTSKSIETAAAVTQSGGTIFK